MPDLLFVINNEDRFIDCIASDESFLLMRKTVFIGKTVWQVIPKEISKLAYAKIKSVLKDGVRNSPYKN